MSLERWAMAGCGFLICSAAIAQGPCQPDWTPAVFPHGGILGDVRDMVVYDPDGPGPSRSVLVIAGSFTVAGGVTANNIVEWDGAHWTPLGSGVNAGVTRLTVFDPDNNGP